LIEFKTPAAGEEVPILNALALAQGIVRQYDVAALYQPDEEMLINVVSLSILRVAARGKHCGKGRVTDGGYIEVRRDVKFRQTFKNDFADHVSFTHDLAHYPRIQRRTILR